MRFTEKLWEEFVFEVLFGLNFPSANHRAGGYETKMLLEGWHYNESLQRVGDHICKLWWS